MNKRLNFVLPDVESAHSVLNELLLSHIDVGHIHFLGKYGTDLGDLPVAGTIYKTDILHGMLIGAITGGILGVALVGGLIAFPDLIGIDIPFNGLFVGGLCGALFGTWASGLIGSSTPNHRLHQFDSVFKDDHILLIVDVPEARVESIRSLILGRHPEAEDHGVEPQFQAFG